jgi:hypothetical protein
MYNINKKSGAMNLYRTARKIWKLSERNYLILKVIHTPGRINVATDKLSRLEMSGDYQLNEMVFQRIQKMWHCYPKVDLFASKKNRLCISNLSRRSRQHRKRLKIELVNHKRACSSTSTHPSSTESIEEIQRRRKNSYIDSSFLEGPSKDRLIRKPDYFNYTTGQIRKHIDTWEGDDKERSPSATRELKCLLVKEFILYYDNKNTKVFDSSAKGAKEYCGPCQLLGIVSLELTGLKNPYFVLLQEKFKFRGISIIDAYLAGTLQSTWRSYKTGWNIFIRFLIEEKISNVDWEDEKTCNRIFQELLNWAFVGRKIPASSINIACNTISKFMCAFITNFNFASSKFIKV